MSPSPLTLSNSLSMYGMFGCKSRGELNLYERLKQPISNIFMQRNNARNSTVNNCSL